MNDKPVHRRIGADVAILLAYAGVAAGMTWPLALRIGTYLPGGTSDTLVHFWNGWWVRQALATGQSPFYTHTLFHPPGISLATHNFAWLSIAAWLLLRPLLGAFGAYNVSLLANLALCGTAAFLLTQELTGDRRAAFLAGLVYECWPFRLAQLDHPNLISTQWIALFLLFLIRVVRRGRRRDGVLAGAFLALTGYTRWQLLIPAAIAGGVTLACTVPEWWPARRRDAVALLLAGGVAALALGPPVLLMARGWQTAPADLLVEGEELTMQTDLLAYVTPSGSHPVLGWLTRPAYDRYYADRSGGRRFPAYVGAVALALALLGAWKARKASLPWVAMALAFFLLALGPTLRLGGQLHPAVPMPYRLAARSFLVRLLRFPDRFNMFLALPMAVLAGYGTASLLARAHDTAAVQRRRWATVAALWLLGGGILFEYLAVPVPLQRPAPSALFATLAAEPGDFAVLNLPIDSQESKRYMFDQVTHHHPILQGKTARFPEGTYDYLDSQPWLRGLHKTAEMSPSLTDVSRQLAPLADDGVRYVILHKDAVDADRLARWQRYLVTRPRFEDERVVAYATRPLAGRDFDLADELVPGLGPIRVFTSTGCLNPGGVLEVDAGWGATTPPRQDFEVQLALVAPGGEVQQEETFPLSPKWPTGEWPANAVAWGYYPMQTDPSLPTGSYTATLALVDPATGTPQGRPVAAGRVTVRPSPCEFPLPPDATRTNVLFGNELRLLGTQLHQDGDRLLLTLHWRAERRMETAYKIFIHVFDPATQAPVAQDDAMPRRWTYPTTFWSPGETVTDTIPISLEGVAPGTYGVALGVYDPGTLERLSIDDGSAASPLDGRLVLGGERIRVEQSGP